MTDTAPTLHCMLCRFPVEIDDARVINDHGGCICASCWSLHVGEAEHRMTKELRVDIERFLLDLDRR